MQVKKIHAVHVEVTNVPALLDAESVSFQPIDQLNWATFPYRPQAEFRIAHTENAILLHFKVKEASVRARYGNDGGSVYTDACVEFFVIPADDGVYYNIECNCIGTILVGSGPTRNERERAPQAIMDKVQRWSSLGREPFEERIGECSWEVALVIPYSVFYKQHIDSLDGKTLKANFYKCGDELHTPHYLSWNPITAPKPDFHRPDCFGLIHFE
ncbi:carbohydrate-binding family 9-like protein [uncultured Bacteroides sp.]|uniref:carbohydrate-binding family 9-like protein n=1 Tax=uncultured Bacteroides sp. TaxID=162156 RepID=UPI002AA8DDCB|nr:carbohydrate-binding family 9-like protein [uncultured Bacteroides sp.]